MKDIHVWGGDESRLFSVKIVYECLANHVRDSHNGHFKNLWKARALPNMLTTAWRVLLDRIPKKNELIKERGGGNHNYMCDVPIYGRINSSSIFRM